MPTDAAVAHAELARRSGLVGILPAGSTGFGMARPGVIEATGPDAARFLHSQLTHDVEGLEPGQGRLAARVSRTGHLRFLLTVHRTPDGRAYRMVLPAPQVAAFLADLDAFLFADEVTLTALPEADAIAVQGPNADGLLDAVFGPVGFEPWPVLPEAALRALRRTRSDVGVALPAGTWAIRRSLTGDTGFVIFLPPGSGALVPLSDAFRAAGATVLDAADFADALDILRIEAGLIEVEVDTAGKPRLLPETGLEQQAVSWTKGCYIGQEVIARVRTYGTVPYLLRALELEDGGVLPALPEPGSDLLHAESGKKIGVITSRTWSPVAGGGVVLAYLHRDHRTPGTILDLMAGDVAFEATVALLPLHAAPDAAAKVHQLYDQAIRAFADAQPTKALGLLEEALRIDPSFGDAYEAIGVMLGRSGHFHEAIDVFQRLEEVAPDEPMVNTNLSLYYMKLGDKQTAEDHAGKATLKQMAKARGKVGAGATADEDLAKAKRSEALRKTSMFSKVLEIDPVDGIALFGMGNALLTLEDYAGAAEHLARAAEVDPKNSAVYAARGKALEKLGAVDEAVAVYKAGVEVASRKGDLMPLKEMEHRLLLLGGR